MQWSSCFSRFSRWAGRQYDPEDSTHQIVEEVVEKGNHPTIPREATKGSKGSLGHGEGSHTWTESQIRIVLLGLRRRYPGVVIYITDDIVTWLIRHVGWLREQYKMGGDGKTPRTRLFGAEYGSSVFELG